jgi:hypothetical protein
MLGLSFKKINGNDIHSQRNYDAWLRDYDCNFYIEKYFKDMLYIERKRAERSKSSLLLMKVYIDGFLNGNGDRKYAKRIAQVLSSVKRETDIAGWHKHNKIMGVMFIETDKLYEDLIRRKIQKKLSHILNLSQLNKIKLTFHIIP